MGISLRTMWPCFSDWQSGGCLWFYNLSLPDKTWGLPIIISSLFLLNVELTDNNSNVDNSTRKIVKTTLQASSFFMIPIFIYFPSGFTLYSVSNIAGLAMQRLILKNMNFRKLLGLES